MNTSSVSTALLSVKGLEFNGSFSEKNCKITFRVLNVE